MANFQDKVVYQIYPKSFCDTNGDATAWATCPASPPNWTISGTWGWTISG